jgi:hypothetical protein
MGLRDLAGRNQFAGGEIKDEIGRSGIVAGLITAVIPRGLLGGTNFMKRKKALRESGAKQNKSAQSCAFRTDSDFGIGSERKSLPEIATVGTKQRDIDAWDQWSLRRRRSAFCYLRRRLMQPVGH